MSKDSRMHKIVQKIKNLSPSEIVAIPGFFLAVLGLLWQAYGYFYNAEVEIYLPDIVEIGCIGYDYDKMKCPKNSNLFVRASALAFYNKGRDKYHAIIRSERVEMKLIGENKQLTKTIKLDWQYFTNRTDVDIEKTAVSPVLLPGSKVVSHEVEFYPRVDSRRPVGDQKPNHFLWFNFVDLILGNNENKLNRIELDFFAEIIGDDVELPVTCIFYIDGVAINSLTKDKDGIGLIPRRCYPK